MAALVLQELTRLGFDKGLCFEKTDATVTSGYKAYLIPNEVREQVLVSVTINSAGDYTATYTLSSAADMAAGTHRTFDVFGAAQTTAQDFELPASVSAVIITVNSGSINIEVRAK